jgi:DoxX-like protein
MFTITTVLSVLLALAMAQTAVRKAVHTPDSDALRDQLEVPPKLWQTIGSLEAMAAIGLVLALWWQPIGIAASAGVALTMIGAVLAHLRLRIVGAALIPPLVLFAVAVVVAYLMARS